MTSECTPEWQWEIGIFEHHQERFAFLKGDNDFVLAPTFNSQTGGAWIIVSDKHARLIAAAPQLLDACEHAAMSIHHPACKHDYPKKCTCHVGKAQAAIKTAKGES